MNLQAKKYKKNPRKEPPLQVGHASSTNAPSLPLSNTIWIYECFFCSKKNKPSILLTGIQTYRGSINGAKLEISFEEAGKK